MRETEPSKRALHLWARLTQWYGQRLADQYGPEPPRDWCDAVDHASNDDIRRALSECRSKHVSHPPTLPEFAALLKPRHLGTARREESLQERITAYAIRTLPLTAKQRARPWTWLHRGDAYAGSQDFEITGVLIPSDGDRPTYRVMAEDVVAAEAT